MTDRPIPRSTDLKRRDFLRAVCGGAAAFALHGVVGRATRATDGRRSARRNIVFILSDDHRYDFMGFMERAPAFLETPAMDRMAARGAHVVNAFVSTSLCSPSRASNLTGQYRHHHHIEDNQRPEAEGTVFFPRYMQKAGYQTAFIGNWHMGHEQDDPRPGFDHWVSFKGQGVSFDPELNVNVTKGYPDSL